MAIQSIDPTSGDVIASYEQMAPEAVQGIVEHVHEAFLGWRQTSFSDRSMLMRKAAQVLRDNARDCARLIAREIGQTP
jgi:succinate-semialdehyde dehydrogenase / glutarate-semialdehyde dehydrogenase